MQSASQAKAASSQGDQNIGVPLEAVLCTDELDRRPKRQADYESENRALVALAQALADSPKTILQSLADTILTTIKSDSAGISLVTQDEKRFYWPAISGAWKSHIGGGTPRNFGPCGDVLDRNCPLMFSRLQRRYTYFDPVQPPVEEAILVPFYRNGKAVGTVWAVIHSLRRKFDAEDMRQLQSLARFASAAYQAVESQHILEHDGKVMRDSERRFREMIDALPAAVYTTDADGRVTHFNPACIAFSGRTPEIGTDHWCITWKLFHADGTPMPHDTCPMAIALKEGRIVRGAEAIAERPDGTRVWFEPYPMPLRDESGKVVGGINMLVDITARKRAEQMKLNLATIVECSEDAIISKDLSSTITSWNAGAERLFGYTAAEAIGQSVTMLMPPEHVNEEPGILSRIRRGERIDHYETVRIRKDGTRLDISLSVSPLTDAHGKIIGASKIARDITERKRAEEVLQIAKQQAIDANRAKDMFLAVLSHELRTPLTPVVMTLAALELNPDLPADVHDDIKMIRRNVELEGKLIDDLLDLSRITSGKLRLQVEKLDINEVIRHACEICAPNIREKGVRLHCNLAADNGEVLGDSARLQQIVWNLLNNAAKFTNHGGDIYVTAEKTAGRLRIIVRDTGMGIAPEILPRIFDAFEQGELRITRQFGGMGLGLAISKLMVERHHGVIRAVSDGAGKGAMFIVDLPALSAEQSAKMIPKTLPGKATNVAQLRLLVVEDNVDTVVVLRKLLTGWGHHVTIATTAAAALALCCDHTFDIILSDLGLPDMTGYELMKQLKDKYGVQGIAMSGYGMEEDIKKGEQAGFSVHLIKPVNIPLLDDAIRNVAAKVRASALAATP